MLNRQFRFTLNLERQWIYATVCNDIQSVDVDASYISEPLEELTIALIALYKSPGFQRVAVWLVEPGQFRWLFDGEGDDVRVRILWFEDCTDHSDRGDLLFDATVPLKRLATQVSGQMHRLLNDLGVGGYHELWGREFPLDLLSQLTTEIDKASKKR